jgi:UDP-N-acetylglucosamine 2-epimerase (non-hydrolysing)
LPDSSPQRSWPQRSSPQSLSPEVAVVLGTRPEIIKLAPVIHHLRGTARLLWTGQHYDPGLTDVFFAGSRLPEPSLRLEGVGGSSRGRQIAAVLTALVEHFETHPPGAVVVQGDTNTTNAASQAAHYCGLPVVHVEAGLRSWDRNMPEEINRLVVGSVADLHCCATEGNAEHLRRVGVAEGAIRVTGNTIVEAIQATLPTADAQAKLLAEYGLTESGFVVCTIHRPENTDERLRLARILDSLACLPWPTVLPLHPRTRQRVEAFGLQPLLSRLRVVDPVDHRAFLALSAGARLLVSDSGGVQEEVTVLKKPLVVVRNSTERPESIDAGFAILVQPAGIEAAVAAMTAPGLQARLMATPSPFGDGHSGERIAAETLALVQRTGPITAA